MRKREIRSKATHKGAAALVAIICLLTFTIGGTLAWLADESNTVVNTLEPQQVTVEVTEKFDQEIKKEVAVKNTCEIPIYIRVALVTNWQDTTGKIVGVPASLDDLEIKRDSSDWFPGTDGYYYYTKSVAPNTSTTNLIDEATVKTTNGYKMNLQVIAQAIQALPDEAVEDAWPAVEVDTNGKLTPRVQP